MAIGQVREKGFFLASNSQYIDKTSLPRSADGSGLDLDSGHGSDLDSVSGADSNAAPDARRAGRIRSTTVICVRREGHVVMAADGQVTLGDHVLKHSAKKIRRLYQDRILAGFAGSTADAFALFKRFEAKLEQFGGNLNRAAVELATDWRTDKMLRNLEALLVVADLGQTLLISGSGDVIDPDEAIAAIGSGGSYATAAARALLENTDLSAREVAIKSMKIAGEICIYTNDRVTIEELYAEPKVELVKAGAADSA